MHALLLPRHGGSQLKSYSTQRQHQRASEHDRVGGLWPEQLPAPLPPARVFIESAKRANPVCERSPQAVPCHRFSCLAAVCPWLVSQVIKINRVLQAVAGANFPQAASSRQEAEEDDDDEEARSVSSLSFLPAHCVRWQISSLEKPKPIESDAGEEERKQIGK